MALARPSSHSRAWASLSLPPSKRPSPRLQSSPINHHLPFLLPRSQQQHHHLIQRKPFHSAASHHAARSPAARRSENIRSRPVFSSDGLMSVPAQGDLNARLNILSSHGSQIMAQIQAEGILDEPMDEETFMRVAKDTLRSVYSQSPSADAAQRIYHDPNVTFVIGHAIAASFFDNGLREWILSACAQAGAQLPLLITAGRYLNKCKDSGSAPIRTAALAHVELLAIQERDPRAMLVHAKALGLRGRLDEALALTREVMEMFQPTPLVPGARDNLLISGVEPPWEMYLWLKGMRPAGDKMGTEDKEVEDITCLAAEQYQHPPTLVRCAELMMQRGDLKMYEACMGKAATFGDAGACRRLGNFYYLTFLGRYPRLGRKGKPVSEGEGATNEPQSGGGVFALVSSFFGPRPLRQYRLLAQEWYRLGFTHGCVKSGIIYSILAREDGDGMGAITEEAFQMAAVESRELSRLVRQLKSQWSDKEYKPEVPYELLDV